MPTLKVRPPPLTTRGNVRKGWAHFRETTVHVCFSNYILCMRVCVHIITYVSLCVIVCHYVSLCVTVGVCVVLCFGSPYGIVWVKDVGLWRVIDYHYLS